MVYILSFDPYKTAHQLPNYRLDELHVDLAKALSDAARYWGMPDRPILYKSTTKSPVALWAQKLNNFVWLLHYSRAASIETYRRKGRMNYSGYANLIISKWFIEKYGSTLYAHSHVYTMDFGFHKAMLPQEDIVPGQVILSYRKYLTREPRDFKAAWSTPAVKPDWWKNTTLQDEIDKRRSTYHGL